MNWTNLKDNLLYLFSATFFCIGIFTSLHAQESSLQRLKLKFENGQVFKADFYHQSVDSYTGDTTASRGDIWIGEAQYKVQTDHQLVVVDGKTSTVYDEHRNRVILSEYEPEEDDFAPSRILNGVDSTFSVVAEEETDEGIYIRLTSDDPFAIYKEVEIFLSPQLVPRRIRAVDPVDNIITTRFRNGKFISGSNELFTFDIPESAEIVDMRS